MSALSIGLVLSASCGGVPPPAEEVAVTTAPFIWGAVPFQAGEMQTDWDEFIDEMTGLFSGAKTISDYYSGLKGGIEFAQTLGRLLGILDPPEDKVAKLLTLVNTIGEGLSWQISESFLQQDYADMLATIHTIDTFAQSGMTYGFDSPGYQASLQAVERVAQPISFQHVFLESGNNGGSLPVPLAFGNTGSINWKSVISARPPVTNSLVYDWRKALPMLAKMIAMRLVVIGTVDPNFRTDHWFDGELTSYRETLKEHYDRIGDIKCASKDYFYFAQAHGVVYGCNVVCADIYTGISAISSITPDAGATPPPPQPPNDASASCATIQSERPADYRRAVNAAAWEVRSRLPLFQLKSMIDGLYTFLHPGHDLTDLRQRISSEPSPNLCVDVQWGSADYGTPLHMWPCNGTAAQQWTYDRQTGQLRNGLGTCMDQRWSIEPGTVIGTWGCDTPQGTPPQIANRAQQWTYDPETRMLQNAVGQTMMASAFSTGAPIWTEAPFLPTGIGLGFASVLTHLTGDRAWRADAVLPSSSCGTLRAGEGIFAGSNLYSCDGRFALAMQTDGNLALFQVFSGGAAQLWTNNGGGLSPASFTIMEDGGKFATYSGGNQTWATDTAGYPGARLVVQDDGNVVIYDASNIPRWATNTCCH